MSVLIFIDTAEGQIKKASFEAMSYGAKVAEQLNTTAEGVILGNVKADIPSLGKYGVKKIHHVTDEKLNQFDAQVYTKMIAQVVESSGNKIIIFSNNVDGKAIAPRLSVRLKAGLVSGAVALPDTGNGFSVMKTVFSGKAFAQILLTTEIKIITLNQNSYKVAMGEGTADVATFKTTIETGKVKVLKANMASGEISLTEADIVVSGGRG